MKEPLDPRAAPRDLIQPLLSDRVDLIGDIHGEIEALRRLLRRLGVDIERARVERPLVFVGDLIDRGPDSVAVVELVEHLVRAGVAQCVLGNHEFNVLRGKVKQGNGWFIPHEEMRAGREPDGWFAGTKRVPFDSRGASSDERARILRFISELPLALEGPALRVVHAAWDANAVECVRAGQVSLSEEGSSTQLKRPVFVGAPSFADMENPTVMPKYHSELAEWMVHYQNSDPLKLLTSGPERPIGPQKNPRYLAGKWRILERSPWWQQDADPRAVVFGHYWRRRPDSDLPGKSEVFEEDGPWHWLGPHRQAFCIDYCVGYRFMARYHGKEPGKTGALAAMRWPERTLIFDDSVLWIPTLRE